MADANRYTARITIAKRLPIKYSKMVGSYKAYRRSSISTKESTHSISISIAANDVTALRASLNSVMRDIHIIESTGKLTVRSRKGRNVRSNG
ncbi:MAG: hypothetical protein M1390_01460 [Candidatus Marsarchaeota archaeon]|jgi:tRNA threonylcarbamoyladenosine modification (KEOPS) complex  Pcc1 subunit|nr:hypothetical protein [Candidatus Marsarchaeota archaeon]